MSDRVSSINFESERGLWIDSLPMDAFETREMVEAIDRLTSAVESLEMRVSSLEGSVGRSGSPSTGGIEQKLDQINRTVNAIRKEMF